MEDLVVVNYLIIFGYVVFIVTSLSALVFPAIQLFQDLKKAVAALVGVVALVVFYLLCFVLAKSEPLVFPEETISAETMKFVEANIFMGYATFAVAVLAVVYVSVARMFK